jgi:hypothetical protein
VAADTARRFPQPWLSRFSAGPADAMIATRFGAFVTVA